jgi:glycosyltransferase involved in cell wall biosynthesis
MFDPDDLDEMRTAVERVATEGSLRQTLVERGQARIKQFSWRRCAEETLFAYRQALQ